MGDEKGNCIFVDKGGNWWLAETENVLGESDIIIIREMTEDWKELFVKGFYEFMNEFAPCLLFLEEGTEQISSTSAKNRKVMYPK